MKSEKWKQARRLLCVRLDALGDVCMTGPAIRALKEANPECQLTLLTSPSGARAARLLREVDAVTIYDAPWLKATLPRMSSAPDERLIQSLGEQRFDGAVIFNVYTQNPLPAALICYFAGIPLRLGYCRENPYQLLTDWLPEPDGGESIRHEVRRQLDLVRAIGCVPSQEAISLRLSQRARGYAENLASRLGLALLPRWTIIHPGASAPSRRYPPEKFAEVARRLVTDLQCAVVFTGSPEETSLIRGIQEQANVPTFDVSGLLDTEELAAFIALAPLLISNNTGPVHLAAGVATPVVDIYAATNPQHTPWQVPHRVLSHPVPCRNCLKSICPETHNDCIRKISPHTVVEAAEELLIEAGFASPRQLARPAQEGELKWSRSESMPPFTTALPVSSGTER